MRFKKVVSILLAMAMMLSLSAVAFATEGDPSEVVAKIGEVAYSSLKEAIKAAQEGDEIVLQKDAEGWISIEKSITLNLGGYTLSTAGKVNLWIEADVTVKNGTIRTTGLDGADVNIGGAAVLLEGAGSLTLAADATIDASGVNGSYAIVCTRDWQGSVSIAGKLTGTNGLTVNGNNTNAANRIVVSDGAQIDVSGIALYLAGKAKTTIGSATIKGETGVEIRAGELEVNGADITATGDFVETPNGNGSTMTGVAIAVSQHVTDQDIKVTINEGTKATATGANGKALYEKDMQNDAVNDKIVLDVQGGDFKGDVAVNSAAEKKVISGGTFDSAVDKELVAAAAAAGTVTKDDESITIIGTSAAVAEAIKDAAEAGSTVDIIAGDVELEGIAGNVTVKNSGDGEVKVNGNEVKKDTEVTTPDVPADTAALDTAVKNAEKLLENTVESTDGKDVYANKNWTTAENRQTLADAIEAAKAVLNNADATQAELDAAKTVLDAAVATFEGQLAAGTKAVDGTVINDGNKWWLGSSAPVISGSTGDKGNVNTGASSGMAVAMAFAAVSLAAAGVAAWKKSK